MQFGIRADEVVTAATLNLAAEGARLTGTLRGGGGEATVENGTVDGDAIAWTAEITSPMTLKLEFSGAVDGDTMSGKVKLGMFGESTFSGTRV